MQFRKCCGFDYGEMGKIYVYSGSKGGTFMAPWEVGKTSPKSWSSHCLDSFGSASVCLHHFGSLVFTYME